MEHQKILNLLNEARDSKFVTRKRNIANANSKSNYAKGNEITYNTEVFKSNLCDYNDAYILLRGYITATASLQIQVVFKNCELFAKCVTKIDGTTTDDAENLDLVMPIYNVIEYSSNNSEATRCLWLYSKDESSNFNNDIALIVLILSSIRFIIRKYSCSP